MPILPWSGVAIGPGLIALTRMPRGSSSPESVLASESSPALVAAYTLELGMPMWALIEVLRTIEAGSARSGSRAWIRKNGPFRLTATERSKPASSHRSSGRKSPTPALTNSTSRPPKARSTASAIDRWPATSPASARITVTSSPSSARVASMPAGLVPVTATRAPSARNCRAASRPMPLVPPVIRARLPSSLFMSVFLCVRSGRDQWSDVVGRAPSPATRTASGLAGSVAPAFPPTRCSPPGGSKRLSPAR